MLDRTDKGDRLRKGAEAEQSHELDEVRDLPPDQVAGLVHDLRTHQIEFEMQNEDLRHAQAELSEARDRYTDLFEFAPIGYATLDRRGWILEANLRLAEMLGTSREALLNQPISSHVFDEDSARVWVRHRRDVLESGSRQSCELQLEKSCGESLWCKLDSELGTDPTTGALRIRTAVTDISELHQAEAARMELERKMFQTQKLESLGVLAGGIAHDFNNLLTSILGNADMSLFGVT